jgi:hypothetical protein
LLSGVQIPDWLPLTWMPFNVKAIKKRKMIVIAFFIV